jgi:hypothetical protein
MRPIELYQIGLLGQDGKVYVPMSPDYDLGVGVAIVDTSNGLVNSIPLGLTSNAGVTGSCRVPLGGSSNNAACVVSYDDGRSVNNTMISFDDNGNRQWLSAATSQVGHQPASSRL